MSKKTKKKQFPKTRKVRTNRPHKRPDFSGLTPTKLRNPMSEQQLTDVISALVVIADDYMPEIDFPFHADSYPGSHPNEPEVMMFFPNVKTSRVFPVSKSMYLNGKHYVVVAFPDTDTPIGERGLMYVCRQFSHEPSWQEETQFVLDSIDGTWIVCG